jgi:hypothetical protein
LYNKILLPRFDKRIEIIDGGSGGSGCDRFFKVKTTITKNKNDHRAARESKSFSVSERDLLFRYYASFLLGTIQYQTVF